MKTAIRILVGIICLGSAQGCRPNEEDVTGQAKLLADPVRREHAIANITKQYTKALGAAKGDRGAKSVKTIADAVHKPLVQTFIDNPEDNQNRVYILDLLAEMRDPRSLPALVAALDWRPEVSEEQAIRASRTIRYLELTDAQKEKAANGLGSAFMKITGDRPVDNRLRKEMILALGTLKTAKSAELLAKAASSDDPKQNFLFNRLALRQLGQAANPSNVPLFLDSLFAFAPGNPSIRVNDIAVEGLVNIGKPALVPVLELLSGANTSVKKKAKQLLLAAKKLGVGGLAGLGESDVVAIEGSYTAGELGYAQALGAIKKETLSSNPARRLAGHLALSRIYSQRSDAEITSTLLAYYAKAEKLRKPQILRLLQHRYSSSVLEALLQQAKLTEKELPQLRLVAMRAYAMLANKAESSAARLVIKGEPGPADGGYRTNFEQGSSQALAAADRCNIQQACWLTVLKSKKTDEQIKAAHMLARYGRGKPAVVAALSNALQTRDVRVREELLYALDHVATKKPEKAIRAITAIEQSEEGKASWTKIASLARMTRARLALRP